MVEMRSARERSVQAALLAVLAVGGCGYHENLRLIAPAEPHSAAIAQRVVEVLDRAGFSVELLQGSGVEANLDTLRRGDVELAIAENSTPWQAEVESLLPLSHSVLHLLQRRGADAADVAGLIVGKRVYAGAPGSMGRRLLTTLASLRGIRASEIQFQDAMTPGLTDVVVLFAPVSPAIGNQISEHYEFFSVDSPEDIGNGSIMEGVALLYPQLEPFVIPAASYGAATPDPVVTLSVASVLVGRSDINHELAHDVVAHLINHKSELARDQPSLFRGIQDNFEPDELNFPLHPGARDFLDRDHPSFAERYAELGGVSLSIVLSLGSGLIAVSRRRGYLKKQRIDRYYTAVLRVQAESLEFERSEQFEEGIDLIRNLQRDAFAALIDEQVAADESFRIFIRLANDTADDLAAAAADAETSA